MLTLINWLKQLVGPPQHSLSALQLIAFKQEISASQTGNCGATIPYQTVFCVQQELLGPYITAHSLAKGHSKDDVTSTQRLRPP